MSQNPIIKLVPNFVDNALEEPAKEIGQFLGNIFFSVFSPINFPMEKYRLKKQAELEQYEKEIKYEISKVKEDNLIEPDLNIVGPAIDASKYYISSKIHRKMFARLVARSMDRKEVDQIHPAFIEIIKQLSSSDAKLFKMLFEDSTLQLPKIRLIIHSDSTHKLALNLIDTVLPSRFYSNDVSYLDVSRCLDNLERHKLISVSDGEVNFNDLLKSFGRRDTYEDIELSFNPLPFHPKPEIKYKKIVKGHLGLTSFGSMFYSII